MKKIALFPLLLAVLAGMLSCSQEGDGGDPFWVLSGKLEVYASATKGNDVLKTLKFGDEVRGREPNLGTWVGKQWIEVAYDNGRGYADRTNLGDKATMDAMKALIDGARGSQVQGVGETYKKTPFRLGPSADAKQIELLKDPAKVDVFERILVDKEGKGKAGKEVWYKVRLDDGRVGFITDRFRLAPPAVLNQYTAARKAVAWRELGEKRDPETGRRGMEYIVAYTSAGLPIDVDFSRIELYSIDPKTGQYGTKLAKSALAGKLPLIIKDGEGGRKIIEIRQIAKGKPGKLLVQEYSYPDPVKMIKEVEIDQK